MPDITFPRHFDSFVCEGDSIETTVGPIRLVATVYRDDDTTPPDERQEGYWPSLDPESDGYIGPRSKAALARRMKRAEEVLEAWKNDEWFYCGVAVRAFVGETPLTDEYTYALWGIECNYPQYWWKGRPKGWHPNHYLREVAEEHAPEAYGAALERLEALADLLEDNPALEALAGLLDAMEAPRTSRASAAWDRARRVRAELESGK